MAALDDLADYKLNHEQIFFDGWELTEGTVRNWEVRDGMDGVAAMVGDNLTVANRSGEVWRPKTMGPGRFQLSVWLYGNTRQQANDAWRTLLRAVYRTHRLITVKRRMPGGESVVCAAELVGSIEPTHLGMQGYRATLTFNVPSGYWCSETFYAHETAAGATLPKALYLNDLAPSTGPLEHLSYTIWGPITNPTLTDNTDGGTGDTINYKGTIPNGGWIRYNATNWSIDKGFSAGYSLSNVNPTGRRLMTITAARPNDVPSVLLTGTGGGAATKLRVYGQRIYLC